MLPGKSERKPNANPPGHTSDSRLVSVTETPEKVYLRIDRRFLRQLDMPTENQLDPGSLSPQGADGNVYVIIADLSELQEFAGTTVNWLIQVAKLIFDPFGSSSLYTFQTETVEYWLDKAMDESWGLVALGDQLKPTIYEFRPDQGNVLPTKISRRPERSMGTEGSQERARVFRTAVKQRQPACIVSHIPTVKAQLLTSHLVPRRLGDSGIQSVFRRFTGASEQMVQSVDSYHHLMGVTLIVTLACLVEIYNVGFWNVGPDQYELHNFTTRDLNIYGTPPFSKTEPRLHRQRITLTRDDESIDNPPIGVFNWHYVQCVLKRFATPEYTNLPNIHHFDLPFHTRDEVDWSDHESE